MNNLLLSAAECRRQIEFTEDSVFRAQRLMFARTIGILIMEVRSRQYINLMQSLWSGSDTLRSFYLLFEQKESFLATSATLLCADAQLQMSNQDSSSVPSIWPPLLPFSPVGEGKVAVEASEDNGGWKKMIDSQLHEGNLDESLSQRYSAGCLQLFSTYGLECARMQRELLWRVHTHNFMELATEAFPPFVDADTIIAKNTLRDIYGLVVSDGFLHNRGGHIVKEYYYQLRVIQSVSPAYPLVKPGDVLFSINGQPVVTFKGIRSVLQGHTKRLELLVLRHKKLISVILSV